MRLLPFFLITLIISGIYFKFFIFGKIPFPGDLLIVSYSPWFDYYKFPVQNPLISDVFSQFFLWKHLAIESFKNMQWPLWNPYSFTGTPLLATYHSSVLYPLNILLLLPKYTGWGIYIYLQTLIAALSFYLFSSLIIKSKMASLAGALIFSLGGPMATWLELGTAGHSMAWLPLALYSISKFAHGGKFRFILIFIIALALIILAGTAQITTYSFVIVAMFSLWLLIKKEIDSKKIFLLFIAIILSMCLTALQLLPSFNLLQKSIRIDDSYTSDSNFGLLNTGDSFKFFIPDYFGNTVTRNYWGTLNYSETSGFLGILSLPLLIYFFIKVRSKDNIFYSGLFSLSLLLAFNNPLSHALYSLKVPLLTSSYASRILFVTLFSAAVMASLAINHIFQKRNFLFFRKTVLWSWSAIVGIISGTIITYFIIAQILSHAPDKNYLKVYLASSDLVLGNFLIAVRNSLIPLAILSLLLVLLLVNNKLTSKSFIRGKLILLFTTFLIFLVFDLSRYFLKFNSFVAKNLIFPNTPTLEFLTNQKGLFRIGREFAEVLPPNTWTAYKLYSIEGYDPIYLSQYAKFMHFLNGGDIRSGTTGRYAEVSGTYQSPYLDTSNVKFYITILRDSNGHVPGDLLNYRFKETSYKMVYKDRSSAILENPSAKERAYFAQNIITADDAAIKNLFMEDKNFNPSDNTALSDNLNIQQVSGKGDLQVTEYSPNKVKIKTTTQSPQVLVLADQYEDGWKAEIDGKETKIVKANLIFRAVEVPSGIHEVVFKYQPESFKKGLRISIISIIVITLISLITIKTKRF